MNMRIIEALKQNRPNDITAALELLILFTDSERYRSFVDKISSNYHDIDNRKQYIYDGLISTKDFLLMLCEIHPDKKLSGPTTNTIIRHLVDHGILIDWSNFHENMYFQFQINKKLIIFYLDLDILDNIFLSPAYIFEKYKKSVPGLIVKKEENFYTGTGFYVKTDDRKYIITAKHNIDPEEGCKFIEFTHSDGSVFEALDEDWILHPDLDIAKIPVRTVGEDRPSIKFSESPAILSNTITLGYPRVPQSDGPYLLAHSGEVNAFIKTYFEEEFIVVSNAVSPGNSGSPVLNSLGLCLGIIVRSLESSDIDSGKEDGGYLWKHKTNVAIPSSKILNFL